MNNSRLVIVLFVLVFTFREGSAQELSSNSITLYPTMNTKEMNQYRMSNSFNDDLWEEEDSFERPITKGFFPMAAYGGTGALLGAATGGFLGYALSPSNCEDRDFVDDVSCKLTQVAGVALGVLIGYPLGMSVGLNEYTKKAQGRSAFAMHTLEAIVGCVAASSLTVYMIKQKSVPRGLILPTAFTVSIALPVWMDRVLYPER